MKLSDIIKNIPDIWIPDEHGNLNVGGRGLTSLNGAPRRVEGYFDCQGSRLTSLDYAPEYVGKSFNCCNNYILSFHNIHQTIKHIGGTFWFGGRPHSGGAYLPTHLLGVCLIKGLRRIQTSTPLDALFARYRDDINLFQEALIDNGFVEQARI